jgi:hypothetical protein
LVMVMMQEMAWIFPSAIEVWGTIQRLPDILLWHCMSSTFGGSLFDAERKDGSKTQHFLDWNLAMTTSASTSSRAQSMLSATCKIFDPLELGDDSPLLQHDNSGNAYAVSNDRGLNNKVSTASSSTHIASIT